MSNGQQSPPGGFDFSKEMAAVAERVAQAKSKAATVPGNTTWGETMKFLDVFFGGDTGLC